MILGYNTNGFAHHDPFEAIEVLAGIGYKSVAITLDHGPLNPFCSGFGANLERLKATLQRHGLRNCIETGARFLLDPRHKHEPTLVSECAKDRERRIDFLKRSIDAAAVRSKMEGLLANPPANLRKSLTDWGKRHRVALS